jgi:hypothetical protein
LGEEFEPGASFEFISLTIRMSYEDVRWLNWSIFQEKRELKGDICGSWGQWREFTSTEA